MGWAYSLWDERTAAMFALAGVFEHKLLAVGTLDMFSRSCEDQTSRFAIWTYR